MAPLLMRFHRELDEAGEPREEAVLISAELYMSGLAPGSSEERVRELVEGAGARTGGWAWRGAQVGASEPRKC